MRWFPPHARRLASGSPRNPRASAPFRTLTLAEPEPAAFERHLRLTASRGPRVSRSSGRPATGHSDVAIDARIPLGSSDPGDRELTPPRADSGRMPFAVAIPSASSPHRCQRGTHLDLSRPWRRHEHETSSRPQILTAPGLPTDATSPDAGLTPCAGTTALPADSARVANDLHHAPKAAGCHDLPHSRRPPKRNATGSTRVPTRKERERRIIEPQRDPPRTATPTDSRRDSRRTNGLPTKEGRRCCHRR